MQTRKRSAQNWPRSPPPPILPMWSTRSRCRSHSSARCAQFSVSFPQQASTPDQVVTGELTTLLGNCDAARSYPSVVTAQVPDLGYGHFPDFSLNQCEITQSAQLAQVLTSLSVGNGSSVTYKGATLNTPKDLMAALVASGHRIEIRNERAYANFVSFAYKQANIRFPVWIDTGIAMASGQNLVIPVGHTQQSFYISGPDVETRVAFYLGIDGAGFFSLTQRRPAWTGGVTYDIGATDDGASDRIMSTLDFAMHYLQRTRTEATTVAAGMPAEGYGFVGVCNDSVSLLESLTLGRATSYPLVRAKSLNTAARLNDGLDDALAAMPKDADDAPVRSDILARVRKMLPLDLASSRIPRRRVASANASRRRRSEREIDFVRAVAPLLIVSFTSHLTDR